MPPRPCAAQTQTGQRSVKCPSRVTGASLNKNNACRSFFHQPSGKRTPRSPSSHDKEIRQASRRFVCGHSRKKNSEVNHSCSTISHRSRPKIFFAGWENLETQLNRRLAVFRSARPAAALLGYEHFGMPAVAELFHLRQKRLRRHPLQPLPPRRRALQPLAGFQKRKTHSRLRLVAKRSLKSRHPRDPNIQITPHKFIDFLSFFSRTGIF